MTVKLGWPKGVLAVLSTSALPRGEGGSFGGGAAAQPMAGRVGGAYGLQLDDWTDG